MKIPFPLLVFVTLFSVLMTACAQGPTPAASSSVAGVKITAGLTYVPDIQFAPFYVAAEKGYFADEGLDVTIRHHGQSESLFGALQQGTEQVVYAGAGEMLQARSQGIEVVNFATMYQHYPVVVIVPAHSPITTISDLRGRTIGLPGEYGENWFGLLMMLKQAGMTTSDVNVQSIGWTAQAALPNGKVDAVIGFSNNDAVRFANSGYAVRMIPLTDGEVPLVSVGLGTMSSTLDMRKDDIVRLKRAIVKSTRYIIDHPDETVQISVKYVPNLSGSEQQKAALTTLKETIKLYGPPEGIGGQHPQRWEKMVDLFLGAGLLKNPVDVKSAYVSLP